MTHTLMHSEAYSCPFDLIMTRTLNGPHHFDCKYIICSVCLHMNLWKVIYFSKHHQRRSFSVWWVNLTETKEASTWFWDLFESVQAGRYCMLANAKLGALTYAFPLMGLFFNSGNPAQCHSCWLYYPKSQSYILFVPKNLRDSFIDFQTFQFND